ncbi:MAG: hypothetical protein FJ086_07060 [Deltaproteobacteria bacterium]|nr:hypothetical protein [Deltaproteobacteria bacterium]
MTVLLVLTSVLSLSLPARPTPETQVEALDGHLNPGTAAGSPCALADAPREASLLAQAPAPAPAAEATPFVESGPGEAAPPLVEVAPEAPVPDVPSAAALAASPQRSLTLLDEEPGRVWMGGILGGLGVLVGGVAGIAVGIQAVPRGNDSIGVGGVVSLLFAAIGAVVGAWVVGPLAAATAMGGWRVPTRVLLGAGAGLLLGLLSAIIPGVGIVTLLAGPTVGVVCAVATSPAESFAGPARSLAPAGPGPLLTFRF